MQIDDDFIGDPEFPRKLLDKKQYVRMNPTTGEPELIRLEPMITEDGELIPDSVMLYIDNNPPMVMEREAAEHYIDAQHCTPLEVFAKHKHRKVH